MTCSTCGAPGAAVYHQGTDDEIVLCPPCYYPNRAGQSIDRTVDETDRGDLIRWLIDNDPNGCYGDREVKEELGEEPLTLETLVALYHDQRYGTA